MQITFASSYKAVLRRGKRKKMIIAKLFASHANAVITLNNMTAFNGSFFCCNF